LLYISTAVIAIHVAVIAISLVTSTWSTRVKDREPQRLVVQTVTLSPSPSAAITVATPFVAEVEPEIEKAYSVPEPEKIISEPEEETPPEPLPQEKPAPKPQPTPKAPPPKPAPKAPAKPKVVPKAPEKKVEPKSPPPKKAPTPSKPVAKATPPKPPAKAVPVAEKKPVTKPPAPKKDDEAKAQAKAKADAAAAQVAAEAKRKKEAEEKAVQEKQQNLLAAAQERIANIGKNRDKLGSISSSKSAISEGPQSITALEIDALSSFSGTPLSDKEVSYRQEIAGRMKLLLRLPQYGAVNIKLTLQHTGKVAKVVVVSAESGENKKYIEKNLPTMVFPPFGNQLGNVEEYTFTITLRNE
jgi:colicin import membrane protein